MCLSSYNFLKSKILRNYKYLLFFYIHIIILYERQQDSIYKKRTICV